MLKKGSRRLCLLLLLLQSQLQLQASSEGKREVDAKCWKVVL